MNMAIQQLLLILISIVIFAAIIRLIYFQLNLWAIKRYRNQYAGYLDALSADENGWQQSFDKLNESQTEIVRLFEQANLAPKNISVVERMGYGYIKAGHVRAWDHLTNIRLDIVDSNQKSFHEAIGYFRARRNETFNPAYWIEFLVFWPRNLLAYLGLDKDSLLVKILQILVLLAEFIIGVILTNEDQIRSLW